MTKAIQLYLSEIPPDFSDDPSSQEDQQVGWGRRFSEKRFREYSASRTLLNQALEPGWSAREYHNKPPTLHNSDDSKIRALSISHSNSWVAVAIGPIGDDINLGLDIEAIRGRWTKEKTAFFCNPEQCAKGLALSGGAQDLFFTELWTQKEAFFKATQQPFVDKSFDIDGTMQSQRFAENFLLSVYSEPALELTIQHVDLSTR